MCKALSTLQKCEVRSNLTVCLMMATFAAALPDRLEFDYQGFGRKSEFFFNIQVFLFKAIQIKFTESQPGSFKAVSFRHFLI